jgi:putative membrane-bound dehydrogenase-like protein
MRQLVFVICVVVTNAAAGIDFQFDGQQLTVPDGFLVEQIAGQPLVERPVSADFDEHGRLYVTDSSGSNEPAKVQQEKRPHRIMRLEDVDGDGKFDQSTVFADKLMFPEGALWFKGSLYVAAPPEIWKFTDTDDDGVAERREVWFDGRTLTNCANDLHGPYLGPDGWIYWCKGAFAEQTYEQSGAATLKTRAAHIFRRRPEGGLIESVMTGGMDNPVELIFTPGGERIFTTTFLVHPSQGHRDGLLHATYGGVYGKDHGVLDNHPRTGELMPVLSHHGASASCGLVRLDSDGLGSGYRNNVLETSFNKHTVTRHVFTKKGATFETEASTLLISDNLDFHPTDVLEDADGSVIVVDTGGWFRLCCPTSQLEKADVLGGIYRIRRIGGEPVVDPRGQQITWTSLGNKEVVQRLNDKRPAVRNRARQQISVRGPSAIPALKQVLTSSTDAHHRLQVVWAATWIEAPQARDAVRVALRDADETVRQAALHSVSVWKDQQSAETLATMVGQGSAHNRRAAAEALGRVGSPQAVSKLLSAVPSAMLSDDQDQTTVDRFLEHSLIYAAIEINSPEALRQMMLVDNDRTRRAALIALDQLPGNDDLQAADIMPLLATDNSLLNDTAWWIAEFHPNWGDSVVDAFAKELRQPPQDVGSLKWLGQRLVRFSKSPAVQQVMANVLENSSATELTRLTILNAMAESRCKPLPAPWSTPLYDHLSGSDAVVRAALSALSGLSNGQLENRTVTQLRAIALNESRDAGLRLRALNLVPAAARDTSSSVFEFVCDNLAVDSDIANRSLAVDFLTTTPLTSKRLQHVARQLPGTGAMELQPLMAVFAKSTDQQVGDVLVASLLAAPAATSLFPHRLQEVVSGFGNDVAARAEPLLAKIEEENRSKVERVEQVLALLPTADIRRGLRVFQSKQASCIACHQRGYLGGNIGPDLNRIGQIRSERDMLESILFPSLTFVRSYEPMSIVTDEGLVHNGLIRDETEDAITLQLDAQKSVVIPTSTIEERQMGNVSIMPAGLEKQLSPQELADLVKYLKEG